MKVKIELQAKDFKEADCIASYMNNHGFYKQFSLSIKDGKVTLTSLKEFKGASLLVLDRIKQLL